MSGSSPKIAESGTSAELSSMVFEGAQLVRAVSTRWPVAMLAGRDTGSDCSAGRQTEAQYDEKCA